MKVKTGNEICIKTRQSFLEKDISLNDLELYEDKINELYYEHGLGVSRVALALGFKKNGVSWKLQNPSPTEKIAFDVLGYKDWDEYKKDHGRIVARVKSKKRRKSGFTKKIKKEIKGRDNHKCRKCGSKDNLEVHHTDGDFRNNDYDNLITLCKSCHSKSHSNKLKKKRNRRINLTEREMKSFSTCSICGKRLANIEAVKRHVNNEHQSLR